MPAQLLGDISLNGIPGAASGSVRFYQPTTLIPVTVYSNDAATAAITQPVPLDANGRSGTPVYVTKMVRMIVYDANGAQLQDIERSDGTRAETSSLVNTSWPLTATVDAMATALATSLGGTNGNFKASATGASARSIQSKLSEQLSVKDFNAKGDGIADDYSAIAAAISAMSLLGGGTIVFPAGTYQISQTLTLSGTAASNILFQGAGKTSSKIRNTAAAGIAISIGGSATNTTFSDIAIVHQTTSTAAAISLSGGSSTSATVLFRCSITGHRIGISQSSFSDLGISMYDTDITCDSNAAASAIVLTSAASTNVFGGTLTTGLAGTGTTVIAGATGQITFLGTTFSGNVGVSTSGAVVLSVGGNTAIGGLVTTLYSVTAGTPAVTFVASQSPTNVPTNYPKSIYISPGGAGAYGDSGPFLSTNVGTTTNYIPNLYSYRHHRVVGTAAAITITISNPSTNVYVGSLFTVLFANSSGGAVTWAFGAAYKVAAVAPATGNQVAVTFLYDGTNYIEWSRGSTVAI